MVDGPSMCLADSSSQRSHAGHIRRSPNDGFVEVPLLGAIDQDRSALGLFRRRRLVEVLSVENMVIGRRRLLCTDLRASSRGLQISVHSQRSLSENSPKHDKTTLCCSGFNPQLFRFRDNLSNYTDLLRLHSEALIATQPRQRPSRTPHRLRGGPL